MTKQEFNDYIDSFDKELDELTDEDLYEIGIRFQEVPLSQRRWNDLVEMLDLNKTGDQFRIWLKDKKYQKGTMTKNVQLLSGQTINDLSFPEAESKLEEIKDDLYKQQTKTRDQRNAYRRTLRDEARIEDIKDLISTSIKDLKAFKPIEYTGFADPEREAVLLFSDLHIGAVVDSFFNKYNPEIAQKRVSKLVKDTIRYCKENKVSRLTVLNLGDLVSGNIHVSCRIENTEDVVSQVMMASELMANALTALQEAAPEVIYRSVTDNHARLTPNLHEHIEKENFSRIIDFYLVPRLKDTKVQLMFDNLDCDLGMFKLLNGKNVLFSHGHRDRNFAQSVMGISNTIGEKIDILCVGHFHSTAVKTIQGTSVYTNASIMGADNYASSVRLYGPAAQTLLMFDGENTSNITINLDIQ